MDDSHDTEISAVLLSFGLLSKAKRAAFLDHLNKFIYGYPQKQRKQMERWLKECGASICTNVHRVAEAASDYSSDNEKRDP